MALLAGSVAAADVNATFDAVAQYESGVDATTLRQVEQWVSQSARDALLRRQLEAGLIRMLGAGTTIEAKRFACQQLAILGGEKSVPALAELLTDTNTVGIACLALANMPGKKATKALCQSLPEARGMTRIQVIDTLGNRHSQEAVKALVPLTYSSEPAVINAAVVALGKIGGKKAAITIASLREQKRPDCAEAVLEASLRIAEKLAATGSRKKAGALFDELLAGENPPAVRRGALGGLLRSDADGGEGRVEEVLSGADALLKPVAIAHLATLKSVGASIRFGRGLSQLQPHEQVWLLEALAIRGDAGAITAATDSLRATNASVRLAAVAALGRMSDARSVPALAEALGTATDAAERAAIELSLVQLKGAPDTDRAIIGRIQNGTQPQKQVLISALARRGEREALPVLVVQTSSGDAAVARAAFQGLGRLAGPEDVPPLLRALTEVRSEDVRGTAADAAGQALGRLADPGRRSTLVRNSMRGSLSVESRCSLIGLLPICGDAPALAEAEKARTDSDGRIADAGIRALTEWPTSDAWEALLTVCRQTSDGAHHALAFRGLTRLAGEDNARVDARLIERYRLLLTSAKDDQERKLVLGALGGAASPEALALATEQLAQAGARAEAEQAVKKIAEAIKDRHPQAAQDALNRLK